MIGIIVMRVNWNHRATSMECRWWWWWWDVICLVFLMLLVPARMPTHRGTSCELPRLHDVLAILSRLRSLVIGQTKPGSLVKENRVKPQADKQS